jgi:branched-chain amino acid transport system permease protein
MMERFITLLASGLSLGAVYALVSLGFVLVFKSTRVLNLAMGEFLMIGTYIGFFLISYLGMPFVPALVIVAGVMGLLGLFVHYGIMRNLVGRPFFAIVLVTIGIAIVIRGIILVVAGPIERARMTALPQSIVNINGAQVEAYNFIILGAALLLVIGFYIFFRISRLGLHMRAVAENLQASSAMGISPDRIYALAWFISLAMAGAGGVFFGHYTAAIDLNIAAIGIRAAPAAIVGGLDSVEGAIVGGLIVGTLEQMGAGYFGADYRDIIPFLILTIMLYVKPAGLFGSPELVRI